MAVQFKDGQVLFDSGSVSVDAACCCGTDVICPTDCTSCCNEAGKYLRGTLYTRYPGGFINLSTGNLEHNGLCQYEGVAEQMVITQNDINNYYAPRGIPVQAGDTIYWVVWCDALTGWYAQLRTGPTTNPPHIPLVDTPMTKIVEREGWDCPNSEIFPYGTARNYFLFDAPYFLFNDGWEGIRIFWECKTPPLPPTCQFTPSNDCDSAWTHLMITGYPNIDWDLSGCSCSTTTLYNEWYGGPIIAASGEDCTWYGDNIVGTTLQGYPLTEVKIYPLTSSLPDECGLFLEIRCQGDLIWKGYKPYSTSSVQATGTYDRVGGCSTTPSQMNVERQKAAYQFCEIGEPTTFLVDIRDPLPTGTCSNRDLSDDFHDATNPLNGNADLWVLSAAVDDEIAIDGVAVENPTACLPSHSVANLKVASNVPAGATRRIQVFDHYGKYQYLRGTFEWRGVGSVPSGFITYYQGNYVRKPVNGDCARFVQWVFSSITVQQDVGPGTNCEGLGTPCG